MDESFSFRCICPPGGTGRLCEGERDIFIQFIVLPLGFSQTHKEARKILDDSSRKNNDARYKKLILVRFDLTKHGL